MRSLAPLPLLLIVVGCDGRPSPAEDTSCLGPASPAQPLHCFTACVRDSDCVTVRPIQRCPCVPWVVNRAFQEVSEEKARREAEAARDRDFGPYPSCGCWGCLGVPTCAAGSCSIRYQCTMPDPDGSL